MKDYQIWSENNSIRKFDADDAGVYVGSIFIDEDGKISKCEVEVEIELMGTIFNAQFYFLEKLPLLF